MLARYLADVVQKGLENVLDNGGDISTQISLANKIVDLIQNTTQEADFATLSVEQRAEQLLALLREQDPRLAIGKTAADLSRPETSIAQSSLFTGAIHEPQMYYGAQKGDRLCRPHRYVGVLHQVERLAASDRRVAGVHPKRRGTADYHHLLHGGHRCESH